MNDNLKLADFLDNPVQEGETVFIPLEEWISNQDPGEDPGIKDLREKMEKLINEDLEDAETVRQEIASGKREPVADKFPFPIDVNKNGMPVYEFASATKKKNKIQEPVKPVVSSDVDEDEDDDLFTPGF